MQRRMILVLTLVVCLGLALNLAGFPALAQNGPQGATAFGKGGAVASVDVYATQVGIEVLKNGGNAVDAAVAAAAALGVVEPFSCGIGGGGFMVIYLKAENRVITIDGRETAPMSAHLDMFKDPDSPDGKPLAFSPNRISNGAAVGVPGTLLTWTEALSRYGTLSLDKALQPAIGLADKGFKVDKTFSSQVNDNKARFAAFTSTSALYLKDSNPPAEGSTFTNPDLAKTYKLLADKGTAVFYRGEIGKAIVSTVQKPPTVEKPPFRVITGGMTMADLDAYTINVVAPVTTDYRGYKIYGMGLPSSGGTTDIEVLNIVESFDLAKLPRADAWHNIIEAMRLSYADRGAYLGDPKYVDVPLTGILSKEFAKERRVLIGDKAPEKGKDARATAGDPLKYQKDPSPSKTALNLTAINFDDHEGLSTTHLTVVDKWGNVVSYTFTIESTGGAGIVVPGYGFLLNNELTDFDIPAPHPNAPEPGKRPRSSMAPTIVLAPDGRVMAFGSPGGSTIITTVLDIAFNVIDFGMPIDQAIAAPRISQRNGGVTDMDAGAEKGDLGTALAAKGHVINPVAEIGAATGIVINADGTMLAAAEPVRRGSGAAMVVEPSAMPAGSATMAATAAK